ncbi:TetR/AcrR family transcriptional regulator [uncultured Shewanella sp.]|uniref:TetR/AcrR family transcriptional regulator n=1 Tax=uncultured Shewanella sp. TaxID=173975 RepID=UPI002617659D|nr:TetR/AcrR family transcriptional regulator [uncultured Shewanella sp.]
MSPTVERIIQSAESQIRIGGYNAFSFREIAKEIGIKSASIHYHFPTKPDLAILVANRYTQNFQDLLKLIEQKSLLPKDRLSNYINLFRHAIKVDKKMCLCGMLASENDVLPDALQMEVKQFFTMNIEWLKAHLFTHSHTATAQAMQLLACLEGSLLLTNAMRSNDIFELISAQLIEQDHHKANG